MPSSVPVVAAVISSNDDLSEVLIVRRGPGQSGAGYWEFPGGKVEGSESPIQALQREILEELEMKIEVGDLIGEETYDYPNKRIRLMVYFAFVEDRSLRLTEHDKALWLRPDNIKIEELSPADRPFVTLIQALRK